MVTAEPPTNLDPQGRSTWDVSDAVVRLRLWSTEYTHPLPEPRVPLKLGSAPSCDVRLRDDSGRLSREHAVLVPDQEGWEIRDLGSKNGLRVDGDPATEIRLCPGVTIQLGGLTLVAESHKFIKLRSLVCRLLGWAPARQVDVDEALQNLREGAVQRTPLILIGDGDLSPVVRRLHLATLGQSAPFVTYDGGDVESAIRSAGHGTLSVPLQPRATAFKVLEAVRAAESASRPRLVLCARGAGDAAAVSARPGRTAVIAMPPLSRRADEISRIVHETAGDIVSEMGAPSSGFTTHDLERLQAIPFSGMADLEDSLRRVVAMRTLGVTAGAKKLGLKHSSLSQWARSKKRKLSS